MYSTAVGIFFMRPGLCPKSSLPSQGRLPVPDPGVLVNIFNKIYFMILCINKDKLSISCKDIYTYICYFYV